MKSKRIIIIFSLLVIAIYVGVKVYCYNKYSHSKESEIPSITITGKMTVNHVDLDENDYITFNNIKFKDIFEGYEKEIDDNIYKIILKDKDGQIQKAVLIGTEDQFVDIIRDYEDFKELYNSVKKENINNDIELLKYMEKHNNDKVKFFMTIKKQKQIYSINEFKEMMLPTIEYVKEIDGYYTGYLFKTNKNIFDVNILKEKNYYFSFIGDYDEEFVNEFINTVIIK